MLSAVIITLNEAQQIASCLESLQGVADEIIVVDAGSTDQTSTICASFDVRWVVRAWEGYAKAKNFGNSLARFPFILSVDADEVLSPALRNALLDVKTRLDGAYRFARLTYYGEHPIRHGGWYPDARVRLFPQGRARWEGDFVHERLILDDGVSVQRLNGDLLHYSFANATQHRDRSERYARLAAERMYAMGQLPSVFRQWLSPLWRWTKMYLLRGGWRDGRTGWEIARGSARAVWLRQVHLRHLWRVGKHHTLTEARLLMVNLSKSWGGGEKWFFTVGQELQKLGLNVAWCCYPGSELHQRLLEAGLPVFTAPLRFLSMLLPGQIRTIRQHLNAFGPDIVLLNASHELKTVGWVARRMGVAKIVFRRGVSYPLQSNALNQWFIRQVPTHFLANAEATFTAFAAAFPRVKRLPHLTLNNGIDPEPWVPQKEERSSRRIAMSARLAHEKGIDRAIAAMGLLREQGIDAELHIWGTGPARPELEQQIKALKLEGTVVLRGFEKELAAELNRCSIFLFTPRYGEGTSLALIEAMLLELPCVVMDSPAMAEVVLDGDTGFVVADGDVPALAERLAQLIGEPELRLQMGKRGRERALQHFRLAQLAEKLAGWLRG